MSLDSSARRPFPATRTSVVGELASSDGERRTRALAAVAETYRAPLCAYVRARRGVSSDEAEEMTQGFLAAAVFHGTLNRYDPARGRFRTFLRVCIDSHIGHVEEAAGRTKRGGDVQAVSLAEADGAVVASASEADHLFEREWARAVCRGALLTLRTRLEARGRGVVYHVFLMYDVADATGGVRPTYDAIARALRIPVTQVTNYLAAARREFRTVVLEHLARLTETDEELRSDVRSLLGVTLP